MAEQQVDSGRNWVPVEGWTDNEWLAVMAKFPPGADVKLAEEWVFEQRLQRLQEVHGDG
jgi:hypothetical protein